KTFSDVVDQTHITQTLRRQVEEGRLSHAYLFTGTRGTGKTTCAKILAKAVNCESPVGGDPCCACPSCLGIESGGFMDVVELDAASNNGVDHVRALRDEAIYSPANVKYRVYIIDEVHMLSTAAFNALLKILEEPPEHLIFVLATTELHKVPATILSRCQRFSFKRIMPAKIASRILHVAAEEGIDLASDGADILARLADGALRDALSLLDQCASSGGRIDSSRVLDTLGLAGSSHTAQLLELILHRDAKAALMLFHSLYAGGKDVGAVLGELSGLCRDLLIRATAPEGGSVLLTGGFDTAVLARLGALCAPQRLIAMTTLLGRCIADLASSANRRTDAELCILRLCDESLCGDVTALCARIERLEAALASGVPAAPVPTAAPAAVEPAPPPVPDDVPFDLYDDERPPLPEEPLWDDEPPREAAPPAPQAVQTANATGDTALWGALLEQYKNRVAVDRRAFLGMCRGELKDATMTVWCSNDLVLQRLRTDAVTAVLEEVTSEAAGRAVHVVFKVGAPSAPADGGDRMQELLSLGQKFDNFTIK
ncbi:MAG: DNA polymerase III subunit gamma/tau, partial [Oscillospiraceae bacterium]|nr:DNA polymerase III subunit gamma/tau [Oscillospiraceae bacterium]